MFSSFVLPARNCAFTAASAIAQSHPDGAGWEQDGGGQAREADGLAQHGQGYTARNKAGQEQCRSSCVRRCVCVQVSILCFFVYDFPNTSNQKNQH